MKTLTRFTQPDVLYGIGTELLTELFDRFKPELDAKNVVIPNPNLADGHYYESVAELFKSPDALPEKLVEAVRAVEQLASPENKRLLEGAFWESPEDLHIQPDATPEETALQIWLYCPYPGGAVATESDQVTGPAAPEVTEGNQSVSPASCEAAFDSQPAEPAKADAEKPGEPQAQLLPAKRSQGGITKAPSTHSPSYTHRRTGKVACLRKEIRDRLNEMISDGLTYAAIIKALGDEGKGLNEDNLTSWRLGGYKEWVTEQKEREDMGLWEEYTLELVKQNAASALNEAAIKMATVQIRKALRAIGHATLETALQANPESYIRLLNSLSRLTTGAITCQNLRLKQEQRQADAQRQAADPDSLSVTAETLQKIERLLRLR